MAREDDARKAIKDLENNPKHTTRTPEAEAQTKQDDMNDPKNHKKDGEMDKKWHKDAQGNWTHPDFE